MGILVALFKGTAVATTIVFALALLKALVIGFGVLFAVVKFAIILIFLALLVSIAVAMLRDWSNKGSAKEV